MYVQEGYVGPGLLTWAKIGHESDAEMPIEGFSCFNSGGHFV